MRSTVLYCVLACPDLLTGAAIVSEIARVIDTPRRDLDMCWFEYCTYPAIFQGTLNSLWIEEIKVCLEHSRLPKLENLIVLQP
jgi:hypothetical protein